MVIIRAIIKGEIVGTCLLAGPEMALFVEIQVVVVEVSTELGEVVGDLTVVMDCDSTGLWVFK